MWSSHWFDVTTSAHFQLVDHCLLVGKHLRKKISILTRDCIELLWECSLLKWVIRLSGWINTYEVKLELIDIKNTFSKYHFCPPLFSELESCAVVCRIVRHLLISVHEWQFTGYGWPPWILIPTQCPPIVFTNLS